MRFPGIFRKQKLERINSPGRIVWNKVIKNKSALAGIIIIAVSVFVALFAYVIAPDNTPNSNEQFLELAAKRPGFKVEMLKVKRNVNPIEQSLFATIFQGQKNEYKLIPISSYFIKDNFLYYELYNEEEVENVIEQKIHIVDVIASLDEIVSDGELIKYTDINGLRYEKSAELIKKEIAEYNITTKKFLLGSDRFGRDMLSRLLVGARISLSVGFIAVLISLIIGLTLGVIAGYYGGGVDNLILWIINVVWSIPTLLLVIAISMALGKGFWQVFIAVGMTMWVEVARVARGQVMSVRKKEYVEAGIALGYSNLRILTKHILPNIMSPIIVISTANFASAILVEAGLSFLGIGVQPPVPSWGGMIKDHYAYIIVDQAYLAIIPGVAIMLLVLAFTLAGNGLRDALDKKI